MAVDHNDFISQPRRAEIQPEFSHIIECVVTNLTRYFPKLIHSLYVYGSVAEGRAEVGKSELDMTVIFKYEPDQTTKSNLQLFSLFLKKQSRYQ